jgi:cytoskeletal protein RodZ
MFTNGEKLKDARLKQGKSIAELSQQTRISPQFLEAIEANDLEALPGSVRFRCGRFSSRSDSSLVCLPCAR